MPSFSNESEGKLATCTSRIQRVMRLVIVHIDFKVIFGHRSVEIQQQLYAEGKSEKDGVTNKSMHNYQPSRAIDIAPYPVLWPDEPGIDPKEALHRARRFDVLAGYVMGVAQAMGYNFRWGGDWDKDWIYNDQKFHDLGHFEDLDTARLP
jgi:hypothetical protein